MATKRQLSANRRNAWRSTGPRTPRGKQRASANARRHGLTSSYRSAEAAEHIAQLASEIAGTTQDVLLYARALDAADATFELARIRLARTALLERIVRVPDRAPEVDLKDPLEARLMALAIDLRLIRAPREADPEINAVDPVAAAIAVSITDLKVLDRYERRAAARRNKALRAVTELRGFAAAR